MSLGGDRTQDRASPEFSTEGRIMRRRLPWMRVLAAFALSGCPAASGKTNGELCREAGGAFDSVAHYDTCEFAPGHDATTTRCPPGTLRSELTNGHLICVMDDGPIGCG